MVQCLLKKLLDIFDGQIRHNLRRKFVSLLISFLSFSDLSKQKTTG